MKFNKKKTFVSALLIAVVALLSTSSLAWFSASDRVNNEFFIADSTDTKPEDIFSIDVWEQKDTNGDGDFNEADDKEYANELDYTDILPGDKLSKIAHVKNTGYYDQYVRVTVTISDATAWINAVGLDINMSNVFEGFDETKWNNISKKIEGEPNTITYTLYYNDVLESEADITLFKAVNIPTTLTQEQAAAFGGSFTVDVKAEAVQTENVGGNAFAAFQTVFGN